MELCESVTIGMVMVKPWKCPFGHEKPKEPLDTDLVGEGPKLRANMYSGTSTCLWKEEAEGKVVPATHKVKPRNDSTLPPAPVKVKVTLEDPIPGYKPANAMKIRGGKVVRYFQARDDEKSEDYGFTYEAHHIIPTKVMNDTPLKAYMETGGNSKVNENIGYNINGCENGIFLPSSIPPSTWRPDLSKACALLVYYRAVMDYTNRQMHGSNRKVYEEFFQGKLVNMAEFLDNVKKTSSCDPCKKAADSNGKYPPPHPLVFRLNGLSGRVEKKLTGGSMNWMDPIIISRSALTYARMSRAQVAEVLA